MPDRLLVNFFYAQPVGHAIEALHYAIDHPFLEPGSDHGALSEVPREWDWVVDDGRRHQDIQRELFPGMAGYYAASDRHLVARRRRGVVGYGEPSYLPHQPLREYFDDLVAAHGGDASAIWSLDGVHLAYL